MREGLGGWDASCSTKEPRVAIELYRQGFIKVIYPAGHDPLGFDFNGAPVANWGP